jgi:hypothetical protein
MKAFLFVLLIAGNTLGQQPVLVWDDFHAFAYPRNAQIAHIVGQVTIEFTLEANSAVVIKKSSGHPLLAPAAEETLKASKLHCVDCKDGVTNFMVVFDFSMANHDCDEAEKHPSSSSKLDNPTHVSFIAEPVCTNDPAVRYTKVRSIQCLYLWRCKKIWLQ